MVLRKEEKKREDREGCSDFIMGLHEGERRRGREGKGRKE